eukprot:14428426-Ditylum_brightwellii.AAC.1
MLQKYWKIETIFPTVSAAIRSLTKSTPSPVIRAYYVAIPSNLDANNRAVYISYQSVLIDLMVSHTHLLLAMIESDQELSASELKQVKQGAQSKLCINIQCVNFGDNLDRIGGKVYLYIFSANNSYAEDNFDFAIPTVPSRPNAFKAS